MNVSAWNMDRNNTLNVPIMPKQVQTVVTRPGSQHMVNLATSLITVKHTATRFHYTTDCIPGK